MSDELKTIKFQMMLAPQEALRIDDWGFEKRIRSRAEAIRRLCQIGIAYDREGKALLKAVEKALKATLLTMDRLDPDPSQMSKKVRAGLTVVLQAQIQANEAAVAAMVAASVLSTPLEIGLEDLMKEAKDRIAALESGPPK